MIRVIIVLLLQHGAKKKMLFHHHKLKTWYASHWVVQARGKQTFVGPAAYSGGGCLGCLIGIQGINQALWKIIFHFPVWLPSS